VVAALAVVLFSPLEVDVVEVWRAEPELGREVGGLLEEEEEVEEERE